MLPWSGALRLCAASRGRALLTTIPPQADGADVVESRSSSIVRQPLVPPHSMTSSRRHLVALDHAVSWLLVVAARALGAAAGKTHAPPWRVGRRRGFGPCAADVNAPQVRSDPPGLSRKRCRVGCDPSRAAFKAGRRRSNLTFRGIASESERSKPPCVSENLEGAGGRTVAKSFLKALGRGLTVWKSFFGSV